MGHEHFHCAQRKPKNVSCFLVGSVGDSLMDGRMGIYYTHTTSNSLSSLNMPTTKVFFYRPKFTEITEISVLSIGSDKI